jgi:hypothetical protein
MLNKHILELPPFYLLTHLSTQGIGLSSESHARLFYHDEEIVSNFQDQISKCKCEPGGVGLGFNERKLWAFVRYHLKESLLLNSLIDVLNRQCFNKLRWDR